MFIKKDSGMHKCYLINKIAWESQFHSVFIIQNSRTNSGQWGFIIKAQKHSYFTSTKQIAMAE